VLSTPDQASGPTENQVPVCYRHPGRETYIRCTRCDRPICPDCMISASVGFQCPECVAEGRRDQPAPRTVAGAVMHSQTNLVTSILVASCVVCFVLQLAVPTFTSRFCLLGVAVADGQWYRLITCGFLHENLIHIGLNMWALWVVGPPLEAAIGRLRFVGLYFVCLLAGSTFSYFGNGALTPALGASGAIFGLFGGLLVLARRMHWNLTGIVAIIALNLVLSFSIPGIDWHAHVGGLVAGVVITAVMVYAPRATRAWSAVAVCAVVVLVCAAMVPVRTQQIDQQVAANPQLGTPGQLTEQFQQQNNRPSLL
jgi:membrane associated rhomboid family serine protease